MTHVQRANGVVTGLYANRQPGYAEEWLEDDDAEVVAFRNPSPTVEQARVTAVRANARRKALVVAIQNNDDAGLAAAVVARYPGLSGDALRAVTDLALLAAAVIRQ